MTDDTFYGSDFGALSAFDPEIAGVLTSELDRIRGGLQLIASENISSPEVLTSLGSTLSNKYAEGYPGRRYYGGCSEVDKAETLAIDRAKSLLDAEHANVQAHSGASANRAVYGAFLQPGEKIPAMSLPHGGHLTHGTKVSFSGKWFDAVHYGVHPETEDVDYDEMERPAKDHRPKVICSGGSAIPRLIDFERIRAICDEVGAIMWVDAAHFIGLVAGKAIPSPVPHADVVTFTTHKVLRGPRSGALVCKEEHAKALDKAIFPMMQGGPQMHTIAAKAVNFKECATPEYQQYAKDVIANSKVLAQELLTRGIRPTTGGTDTHPALLDLRGVGVTGVDAEARCDAAGITLNKNAIPNDPQKPSIASGIRVGTPCVTTQGMGADEMVKIAELIHTAVTTGDADPDHEVSREVRAQVTDPVTRFPAYPR
ncbi:serine hydroxymethyltransferase [Janibacter limosus]|uniref:serine hydroxymethyltransferase n=1 Tax=Janibacter limosus TaxID=53458 RepID=UPI0035D6F2CC|nr:serine hydroxymethyltransferase [Janibacter limosus]